MSNFGIDHEAVRARVEQRLQPRMKLLKRRNWLFFHMALFVLGISIVYGPLSTSPLFFLAKTYTQPGGIYPDSYGKMMTIPDYTFTSWSPYPLVTVLSMAWLALIAVHVIITWMAFGRERMIQREVNREMELEKMRLQLELTRARGLDSEPDEMEKPKRGVSLADDGELHFEETPARRRNANHRSS